MLITDKYKTSTLKNVDAYYADMNIISLFKGGSSEKTYSRQRIRLVDLKRQDVGRTTYWGCEVFRRLTNKLK